MTERNISGGKTGTATSSFRSRRYELPITLAGNLTTSTSPPWRPREPTVISGVRVYLGTAGSTDTVVAVVINNAVLVSVTVPAGQSIADPVVMWVPMAIEDTLTGAVITPGSGAGNLTIVVEFG